MPVYFGEMHTHTYCGGSVFGTVEEAAEIARKHLDFWAPGEHADHPRFDWERIVKAVRGVNEEGKFVAFPGFEVACTDGDFNAYFPRDDVPPFAYEEETLDLEEFFDHTREHGGIVVPHHTGYKVGCRGMQWDRFYRPDLMPVVEIFSMHGSSESDDSPYPLDLGWMGPREQGGCVIEGLKRGFRFGFIASSDGHNAYPGSYGMGLAAVVADELTREAIFKALRERRCYAVTGDRILLDFRLDDVPFGGEVEAGRREVHLSVRGLDALDCVDVVKNGRIVKRFCPIVGAERGNGSGPFVVRIGWGWGPSGRYEWEGWLEVKDGLLSRVVPCFGPPPPDDFEVEGNSVRWRSTTHGYNANWTTNRYRCGDECALVLEIEGDKGTIIDVEVGSLRLRTSVGELLEGSKIQMGFVPAPKKAPWAVPKLKFYTAVPKRLFALEAEFEDEARPGDFYYLRVRQCNGQMAWSSPVFCVERS